MLEARTGGSARCRICQNEIIHGFRRIVCTSQSNGWGEQFHPECIADQVEPIESALELIKEAKGE